MRAATAAPVSRQAAATTTGGDHAQLPSAPESGQPRQAAGNAGQGPPAAVVSLRARRGRLPQLAAAAAAAVILAAGGIWGGLTAASSPAPRPLAECARAHQCSQVTLTDASGHREAARVIVRGQSAWLTPAGLPADNAQRQIYVLWQITGNRTPLAVGSFDVRAGEHAPIKVGTLASSYSGTWAFAVSLEHGRSIPAHPSRPVALGPVAR